MEQHILRDRNENVLSGQIIHSKSDVGRSSENLKENYNPKSLIEIAANTTNKFHLNASTPKNTKKNTTVSDDEELFLSFTDMSSIPGEQLAEYQNNETLVLEKNEPEEKVSKGEENLNNEENANQHDKKDINSESFSIEKENLAIEQDLLNFTIEPSINTNKTFIPQILLNATTELVKPQNPLNATVELENIQDNINLENEHQIQQNLLDQTTAMSTPQNSCNETVELKNATVELDNLENDINLKDNQIQQNLLDQTVEMTKPQNSLNETVELKSPQNDIIAKDEYQESQNELEKTTSELENLLNGLNLKDEHQIQQNLLDQTVELTKPQNSLNETVELKNSQNDTIVIKNEHQTSQNEQNSTVDSTEPQNMLNATVELENLLNGINLKDERQTSLNELNTTVELTTLQSELNESETKAEHQQFEKQLNITVEVQKPESTLNATVVMENAQNSVTSQNAFITSEIYKPENVLQADDSVINSDVNIIKNEEDLNEKDYAENIEMSNELEGMNNADISPIITSENVTNENEIECPDTTLEKIEESIKNESFGKSPELQQTVLKPKSQNFNLTFDSNAQTIIPNLDVEFKMPNAPVSRKSTEKVNDICEEQFTSSASYNFGDYDFDFLQKFGSNTSNTQNCGRDSVLLKFDPLLAKPIPQITSSNFPKLEEEDEHSASLNTDQEESKENSKTSLLFDDFPQLIPLDNKDMSVEIMKDIVTENEKQINLECEETKLNSFDHHENQNNKLMELENKMRMEAEQREEALLKRISEKDKQLSKMNNVVKEYEKAIAGLIAEKEQLVQSYDKKCADLKNDSEMNAQHLASLETTFSDLHSKYERTKQIALDLKEREEQIVQDRKTLIENLKMQEARYDKMKMHAMSQLEIANNKLAEMLRNHQAEVTKLKAQLKKEEISRASINEQLIQKSKENAELVKICDELIGNHGNSHAV